MTATHAGGAPQNRGRRERGAASRAAEHAGRTQHARATTFGALARMAACVALAWSAVLAPAGAGAADNAVAQAAQAWEQRLGARIGLSVFDTGTLRQWSYRSDQRFPMASTSKAFLCAALLHAGPDLLNRQVTIRTQDLLAYAPVTREALGQSRSAAELCAITLRTSDNTAANRVLDVLGGPAAVTRFLRASGDAETRLDRNEPALNEAAPGDPRDTTTPRAAAHTLAALLLGPALPAPGAAQLTAWLAANEVAAPLLRASLPAGWQIADRSGAGGHGTRAILAAVWPPGRSPVMVAIYLTDTAASMEARNHAIAALGAVIFRQVTKPG